MWPTLGTAVWALRQAGSFGEALRMVIDIGGDTDTVACVSGGLLGAVLGIQAIPPGWTTDLHGALPGHQPVAADLNGLEELALSLDAGPWRPPSEAAHK